MIKLYRVIVFIFIVSVLLSCRNDFEDNTKSVTNTTSATTTDSSLKNNNKCTLEITQIQPTYKTDTKTKNPIFEYVELTALSSGNLSTLQLYSAYYGESKKYTFPSLTVTKGEKIVVHLRSGTSKSDYADELGDDLNAASAFCALNNKRDLWDHNNIYDSKGATRLQDTSDIVILRWGCDNKYEDIAPYSKSASGDWNEKFSTIIADALDCGAWDSELLSDAINANGCTVTRPMKKVALDHTKNSWVIGESSSDSAASDDTQNTNELIDPLNIEITKIQMKYASSNSGDVFEYVEITAHDEGNIAGYKIYSVGDGLDNAYIFPNYNVTNGEKIIIHLRSCEGALDELHNNLSECTLSCAFTNVRDFWDKNNAAQSGNKFTSKNNRLIDDCDILILCDKNNNFCDVVPYSNNKITSWANDNYTMAMDKALTKGFWIAKGNAPSFSCNSTATTINAPLLKMNAICTKASWTTGTVMPKTYNPNNDSLNADANGFLSDADDSDGTESDFDSPSKPPIDNKDLLDGDDANNTGGVESVPSDFTFSCGNILAYDMAPNNKNFSKNGYTLSSRKGVNALISEIQATYFSKNKQTEFYNEYIELYFKTGGNLGDLRIDCMKETGSIKVLTLPNIAISDNEVVILHLTNKGDGCVSETGSNFALATSKYSSKNARDIYLDMRVKSNPSNYDTDVLSNKLGAIILYDKDDAVMDFVTYFGNYSAIGELPNAMKRAVDFAISAGLWTKGHYKSTIDNAGVGFYITDSKNPCTRVYDSDDKVFYTGHEAWFQNVVGGTPGSILNPQ